MIVSEFVNGSGALFKVNTVIEEANFVSLLTLFSGVLLTSLSVLLLVLLFESSLAFICDIILFN